MFLYKNLFFFNICYFNPNHAYWNQRRLFSGNLPGMFSFKIVEKEVTDLKYFSRQIFENEYEKRYLYLQKFQKFYFVCFS